MRSAGLVVETTTTMKVAPTASNTGGAGKGEEESALVLQLRRAKVVLSESSSRRYMPPEWCEKRLLFTNAFCGNHNIHFSNIKKRSFYPDRLGTKKGKVGTKGVLIFYREDALGSGCLLLSDMCENGSFESFITENNLFTKAGSGQT
eukprot:COSAG06_NODE_5441_length_3481_cov_2.764932_3_plen_147_part_00